MGKDVLHLTSSEFDEVLIKNSAVIADFWATWCVPCNQFSPIFDEVAAEHEGDAVFVKIDFDANKELALNCRVTSIPTVCFFKNGKLVGRLNRLNKKKFLKFIEKYSK